MSLLLYSFQWLVGAVVVFFSVIYLAYKYQFQHWKKKNLPYVEPSFPMGNYGGMFNSKTIWDTYKGLYHQTKQHKIFGGWAFFNPILLVNDPEIIKNILVRDFDHFSDRGAYVNTEKDPLSEHLFVIDGVAWRNLRVKLTPTFTSGKMKMMYETIIETAEELIDFLKPQAENKSNIEIKSIMTRLTTDVIASVAFGIKAGAIRNPDATFRVMGQRAVQMTKTESIKQLLNFVCPGFAKYMKFKVIPLEVEEFFMNSVKETVDYRKKNNVKRNDFLQLLIQLMDKGYIEDVDVKRGRTEEEHATPFRFEEAAAQAFVFFIGGFESSATTIQLILYELARQPDIQEKLVKEIDEKISQHNGKMTYEALFSMHCLDRVINEILRIYSIAPILVRKCVKDCYMPDINYTIEKGTTIHIPIAGLHSDPQYFPNPDKFDPDRFLPEEVAKRHHYTYLPFGEGPRNCIGNRFALMQTKIGLTMLLRNFSFEVCEKTPIPLVLDPKVFMISVLGGMYLRIVNRK